MAEIDYTDYTTTDFTSTDGSDTIHTFNASGTYVA